jgi:hypothetical protein
VLAPAAAALCAAFFERVSEDARFLTNGDLAEAHASHAGSAGWQPLLGGNVRRPREAARHPEPVREGSLPQPRIPR